MLGTAGYFGIRTLALVNDAEEFCYPDGCEDPGLRYLEKARTAQTTGLVLLGAGLATVGAGVALGLTAKGPNPADEGKRTGEVGVTLGPTGIGVRRTW